MTRCPRLTVSLLLLLAACKSTPSEPNPERPAGNHPQSPPVLSVIAPPWFNKGLNEGGRRAFDGRGEAATADEATQSARVNAWQYASQSVITEISSSLSQVTTQDRENDKIDLRQRVVDDLKAGSESLLTGAKVELSEVLTSGSTFIGFVRISLPESEFTLSPDWFLSRVRGAAQRGDAARERMWLTSGLQSYPEDEKLLKANAAQCEDRGDLDQALRHYQTLAHSHPADQWGQRIVELAQQLATGFERANNYSAAVQKLRVAQQWATEGSEVQKQLQADIERLRRKQENPFATASQRLAALARNGAKPGKLLLRQTTAQLRRSQSLEMLYSVQAKPGCHYWTMLIEPEVITSDNALKGFTTDEEAKPAHAVFELDADSKDGKYLFIALAADEPFSFARDSFERDRLNDPALDTALTGQATQAERLQNLLDQIERGMQSGKILASAFEFTVTP
ncbi:MAG: hypothetical protein U1E76_18490 [Planctomycetota bacterium]